MIGKHVIFHDRTEAGNPILHEALILAVAAEALGAPETIAALLYVDRNKRYHGSLTDRVVYRTGVKPEQHEDVAAGKELFFYSWPQVAPDALPVQEPASYYLFLDNRMIASSLPAEYPFIVIAADGKRSEKPIAFAEVRDVLDIAQYGAAVNGLVTGKDEDGKEFVNVMAHSLPAPEQTETAPEEGAKPAEEPTQAPEGDTPAPEVPTPAESEPPAAE